MSGVEAYLADLGHRLGRSLPKQVAAARLREARAHLEEAAMVEGEAAALRRFGSPIVNARAIVRQARGYDSRGAWALSWGIGIALALAFLVPNVRLNQRLAWTYLDFRLSVWLPFLAVLAFAARCLRTRRWLALPASLWTAAGIALIYAASARFPLRLDAAERAANLKAARGDAAMWERNAREVALWREGRPPLDAAPTTSLVHASRWVAGLPLEVSYGESVQLEVERPAPSIAEAQRGWREHGQAWAAEVARRLPESRRALAAAEAGREYASIPYAERLRFGAVGIAQVAAVLLAFNALTLLLGRLADSLSRPARRARS